MKYNFDKIVKRGKTGSIKWDFVDERFCGKGLLPMWVADMDFEAPAPVIDALLKRAAQGVFGYTAPEDSCYEAVISWFSRHHNWKLNRDWIVFSPGVVPAISMLIQTFTEPGGGVIVQKPVYYPFMRSIRTNERIIINNPLVLKNGRYEMNIDGLEKKIKDSRAKLMILCSPHNPVGRVWTADELNSLGEICIKNNVLVVSDEIHCDLTLNGNIHLPFAGLSENFLMNSITCTAPSKTFNLAGLQMSNIIIADPGMRKAFRKTIERNGLGSPNAFGTIALEAAYTKGGDWLKQVLKYIEGNLDFLKGYISKNIPAIKVIEPEATYLVWLDFRELGLGKESLTDLLRNRAGVALDEGYIFGEAEGIGFARMNIACPRKILKDGLVRIENAVKSL